MVEGDLVPQADTVTVPPLPPPDYSDVYIYFPRIAPPWQFTIGLFPLVNGMYQ